MCGLHPPATTSIRHIQPSKMGSCNTWEISNGKASFIHPSSGSKGGRSSWASSSMLIIVFSSKDGKFSASFLLIDDGRYVVVEAFALEKDFSKITVAGLLDVS